MATAKLNGADVMKRTLQRLGENAERELGAALFAEGSAIMAQSKQIVPVDTGALRASGTVLLPEKRNSKVTVTMGYGGTAVGYAIPVHEKLSARHKSPTRAKYLEGPFRAAMNGMLGRIAGRLRNALQRAR